MCSDVFFLLLLCEDPVIVDIINNFWRNGDGGVLFVPIIEEEFVVEHWPSWFLLAFLKLGRVARRHCLFVLLSGCDLVRVLGIMLFDSLCQGSGTVFAPLLVFGYLCLAILFLLFSNVQPLHDVLLPGGERQVHPLEDQTKRLVVGSHLLLRELLLGDALLDVVDRLVGLHRLGLWPQELVLRHLPNQIGIPSVAGNLPEQVLGVFFADVLLGVFQEVVDALEERLVSHDLAADEPFVSGLVFGIRRLQLL